MLKLFDTVRLLADLPVYGLRAGAVGSVILVYEMPEQAYEVEFAGEQGRTIATAALKAEQIALTVR